MSNRLLKLLPVLLAFFVICSVCAFAVLADDPVSDDASAETSTEASTEESAEDSAEESADESEDTSAEGSEDESEAASEAASAATSSAVSAAESHDHSNSAEEEEEESNIPWQLIITLGVIVIIVAVLFILAKTNSKAGQKISKFFKDYKSEIKKVVWMPRKDLLKSTAIVLVVLVGACIIIGLLDLGFSSLLNLISSIG